jgi:hypothetical protein
MTQQLTNPQWDNFNAIRTRMSRNGLAMMPVAGPFPQPAQVVGLNGGLEFDLISFVAIKRGEPPTVPSPRTQNNNRVFLRGSQSAPFPIQDFAGVTAYGVAGWYVWGILAPEGLESDFMIGSLPFPGLDRDERIPNGYFSYQLVNQLLTRIVNSANVPNLPPAVQRVLGFTNSGGG